MTNSKTTARKIRSQLIRQRLFDTAIGLFFEKGYDNVTIDEICHTLGMTKGTFYAHFNSKYDIVVERVLMLDEHYRLDFVPQIAKLESPRERLLTFIRMALKHTNELGKESIRSVYRLQIGSDPKLAAILTDKRALYTILQQLVFTAQQSGEIRNDLPSKRITQVIMHNLRGILYNWGLVSSNFDLEEAAEDLIKVLATGLQKQQRAGSK